MSRDANDVARDYARRQEQGAVNPHSEPRYGRLVGQWGTEVDGTDEHLIAEHATVQPYGEHYLLVDAEAEDGTSLRYFVNMAKYRYLEFRVPADEGE